MPKCVDCGEEAVAELDELAFCAECADEYEEE